MAEVLINYWQHWAN